MIAIRQLRNSNIQLAEAGRTHPGKLDRGEDAADADLNMFG
jgi:hypothetical protein